MQHFRIKRLLNTTSIRINSKKIANEIIEELSKKHIFVSGGSACNAYENKPSHVLTAIGLSKEAAERTIRISLSRFNTVYEIDEFIKEFSKLI